MSTLEAQRMFGTQHSMTQSERNLFPVERVAVISRDTRGRPFAFVPALCDVYSLSEAEAVAYSPSQSQFNLVDGINIPEINLSLNQAIATAGARGLLRRHTPGIALIVSQECNLACTYCLAKQGTFGLDSSRMSIRDIKTRIASLFDEHPDIDFLKFFGGEPTLNMDLIRDICEYVTFDIGKSVHFALTTNGTLDAKRHIDTWKRFRISVSVSLDGPEHIHDASRVNKYGRGSFKKAVAYCETLRKENFPFAVVGVFDERHFHEQYSYTNTIQFLNQHSPLTKVVFVEALGDALTKPSAGVEMLIAAEAQVIDSVDALWSSITSTWVHPGAPGWFYDNNLMRFLSGIASRSALPYEHACTASNLTTIFPSGELMPCYTFSEREELRMGTEASTPKEVELRRKQYRQNFTWEALRKRGVRVPWYRGVVGDVCVADMLNAKGGQLEQSALYRTFQETAVLRLLQHFAGMTSGLEMARVLHAVETHRTLTGEYTAKINRVIPSAGDDNGRPN